MPKLIQIYQWAISDTVTPHDRKLLQLFYRGKLNFRDLNLSPSGWQAGAPASGTAWISFIIVFVQFKHVLFGELVSKTLRPDPRPFCWSAAKELSTISQNNSGPCRLPQSAFHCGDLPVHKAYSYTLGFGLGNKEPVCILLCFLICFLRWVIGAQANVKGLGWPLLPIRDCLLVWSMLAKAQGRALHQLRNNSMGPLLGSRTPPQNWGRDNVHCEGVYEAIIFFCVKDAKLNLRHLENHKNTPSPWTLFLLYKKKNRRFNRP